MKIRQLQKTLNALQGRANSRAGSAKFADNTTALEFAANHGLIQEALDAVDQGMAIFDDNLRLVLCNRRFPELLGYPDEMARPGTPLSDFIRLNAERGEYGPGDVEDLLRHRLDLLERKTQWTFERTRPDGLIVEIRHNRLPGGGLISTYKDITEAKKIDRTLLQQSVVLEQLNEAVIVNDLDRVITDCNLAAARMFGYDKDEIIGNSPDEFLADSEAWNESRPEVMALLSQGQNWAAEVRMKRRDGSIFLSDLTLAPLFDTAGRMTAMVAVIHDITERKRNEVALQQQAVLMEQLNEAVIVNDLDRRIINCNLAAEKMFGYSRDELIGKTPGSLSSDPDSWNKKRTGAMSLIDDHKEWTGEVEYRRKDGTTFLGELTLAPLFNDDGERHSLVGIIRDITERSRAEEAIRASEEKYHTLFESIQDGIVIGNLDGTINSVNKAFARMLGRAGSDALTIVSDRITPDKWLHVNTKLVEQVMERGYSDEFEKEYIRTDGTIFPAAVRGWLVKDKDGNPSGRMTIIRDITDKKREEKAQKRQMAIIESTSDLVAMIDKDGQLIYMNRAGREMIGFAPDEELTGLNFMDFHTHDSKIKIAKKGLPVVASDGLWQGETVFLSRDGREIFASQLIIAHKGSDDEIEFYSTIARDVTDRSKAIGELLEAKEKAEIANRAKTEFLANMSHELRTPLNAIIGFSKMMQDRLFGELGVPQYEEYVTSIHDSGEHLLQVINDILDLSKIEAGKFEIDEYPVDVAALIEWCLNTVKPRAQTINQKLSSAIDDNLPFLLGDERVLRQVLLNLLSNSMKFTPKEGSISVTVTHDGDGLTIKVRDTGVGIPKDKMEHVFRPFGQVDGTLSRRHGGTGLGLSITKSLVEMHGGSIALESEVDVGTLVTLHFPPDRLE